MCQDKLTFRGAGEVGYAQYYKHTLSNFLRVNCSIMGLKDCDKEIQVYYKLTVADIFKQVLDFI